MTGWNDVDKRKRANKRALARFARYAKRSRRLNVVGMVASSVLMALFLADHWAIALMGIPALIVQQWLQARCESRRDRWLAAANRSLGGLRSLKEVLSSGRLVMDLPLHRLPISGTVIHAHDPRKELN